MSFIRFEIKNGIAIITLDRPERFNSFNREMALDLQTRLDEANGNGAVRSVYITGTGKAFSAGQDLIEVIQPDAPGMDKILSEHYNPIITQIRELNKPVVAAVNGVAAGAGANIALACDIVVAAESAYFIQAFSKIGLIPDSGGTYFLPRLVGSSRAMGLAMLGDKLSAEQGAGWGLVWKCVDDVEFRAAVEVLVHERSAAATRGLAATKQAIYAAGGHTLEA